MLENKMHYLVFPIMEKFVASVVVGWLNGVQYSSLLNSGWLAGGNVESCSG